MKKSVFLALALAAFITLAACSGNGAPSVTPDNNQGTSQSGMSDTGGPNSNSGAGTNGSANGSTNGGTNGGTNGSTNGGAGSSSNGGIDDGTVNNSRDNNGVLGNIGEGVGDVMDGVGNAARNMTR